MANIESIKRSHELTYRTQQYLQFKEDMIYKEKLRKQKYLENKKSLLEYFDATEENWNDYKWQLKHRIEDIDVLKSFIELDEDTEISIKKIVKDNRFAVVPYYLALITDSNDPIYNQCIPSVEELKTGDYKADPMNEEFTNPAGSITRRYPDRLIINVTNSCAMFCRHCQRRRLIKKEDYQIPINIINESITFIKEHKEIRDVLITGGDALLLSDQQIEYMLSEIRAISHVEIIRIGTRTPVTMPMRITDNLVSILKKYHPVYVNTHFNHSYEITEESSLACERLVNAGISVGNQSVLLEGVNNHPFVIRYLNQKLLKIRVRPYYIFHAKKVKGTAHFVPKIEDGLKIMEHLRGNTSGMAIPTYILNAPGGLGKIPLLPQYIISHENNIYTFKTWEGKHVHYEEDN